VLSKRELTIAAYRQIAIRGDLMNDTTFGFREESSREILCFAEGRPRLSIVVPCYNEAACLDTLYRRVSDAAQAKVGDSYELVMVDDGSRDRTWETMRAFAEQDRHILALRLSRNHGHQRALSAGLDVCSGELILIIDADLQDPPELLGPMMERMEAEGADVVYGARTRRHGETFTKRLTAKLFYRLLSAASDGTPIPLDTGDFRLMTRRALDVLRAMPEEARFIRGMVAWIGFRQVPFEYERDERLAGETHYPFFKMLRLALDALTGFSSLPLRLASYAGMLFTLLALILTAYSLVAWLSGEAVAGWTSLIVVVLVMGAVQLFVLGVLGQYLGRLYTQSKNRPLYIIGDYSGEMRERASLGIVASSVSRPCPVR
jgi:dolichol-phosphate mannosyltransferase